MDKCVDIAGLIGGNVGDNLEKQFVMQLNSVMKRYESKGGTFPNWSE